MYKGYTYRTHFKRNSWQPERFTEVRLYTEEEAKELSLKERKNLVKIQAIDIPFLNKFHLKEPAL